MRNYSPTNNFFMVDVLDTNVVLGGEWVYALGNATTNWQKLEMEFKGSDGKPVVLRGMHSYPPQTILAHQMEAYLQHGDVEWTIELQISELGTQAQAIHPDIEALLERHRGFLAMFRQLDC